MEEDIIRKLERAGLIKREGDTIRLTEVGKYVDRPFGKLALLEGQKEKDISEGVLREIMKHPLVALASADIIKNGKVDPVKFRRFIDDILYREGLLHNCRYAILKKIPEQLDLVTALYTIVKLSQDPVLRDVFDIGNITQITNPTRLLNLLLKLEKAQLRETLANFTPEHFFIITGRFIPNHNIMRCVRSWLEEIASTESFATLPKHLKNTGLYKRYGDVWKRVKEHPFIKILLSHFSTAVDEQPHNA